MTIQQITDGTSNTFWGGEKAVDPQYYTSNGNNNDAPYAIAAGGTGRPGLVIEKDNNANGAGFDNEWGSPYGGGCPFLMYDGSVHSVAYGTDTVTMTAYLTAQGGDLPSIPLP